MAFLRRPLITMRNRTRWRVRKFKADRSGHATLMLALSLVPIIGLCGAATDTIQWYLWRSQLQRAADSAALAGANTLPQVPGVSGSVLAQTSVAVAVQHDLSFYTATGYSVDAIETPPKAGSMAGNANSVRVALSTTSVLPFSSLFLPRPVKIATASTAQYVRIPTCVLALDPSASSAVYVGGSSQLSLNCAIAANSSASQAITLTGTAISATEVHTPGGINASSVSSSTVLHPHSTYTADPYSGLPTPDWSTYCAAGSQNLTVNNKNSTELAPGCYTGLSIKSAATLEPGIYYIGSGGLSLNAGASLSGTGVVFVMTNQSSPFDPNNVGGLSLNGSAQISLSAPTAGTYAGVLIAGDPRANTSNGASWTVAGNASSFFQGAFYSPNNAISFNGTSGMNTNCTFFVAKTVSFGGNASLADSCPANSGANDFGGGSRARLVE